MADNKVRQQAFVRGVNKGKVIDESPVQQDRIGGDPAYDKAYNQAVANNTNGYMSPEEQNQQKVAALRAKLLEQQNRQHQALDEAVDKPGIVTAPPNMMDKVSPTREYTRLPESMTQTPPPESEETPEWLQSAGGDVEPLPEEQKFPKIREKMRKP